MRRILLPLLILVFFSVNAYSLGDRRQLTAVRTAQKINIDGKLDELVWSGAPAATDFVTYSPTMGLPATQRTEVKVLYDNKSVYFGIRLFDQAPDSILRELTKRDAVENANTDQFKISLNPYNDGQNLFQFLVSAANVQADSKQTAGSGGEEMYHHGDPSWNAVWFSKTSFTPEGWLLEIEIPFAALRFPKQDVQVWGINFLRTVRRTRETTTWNPIDRNFGEESQVGELVGIRSVKSPIRLELYPFAAGYYQFSPDGNGFSYAAGMDLKYGINDAYTLDMTLIPDFGQRKSDQVVLNLTPYEVKYSENRQFFTEGMELFDKSGLFYSRRIGKQPVGYYSLADSLREGETIVQNPEESKLINVTKITGRNSKNLGIGFLNAMTANTYARVAGLEGAERRVLTDPFSNYNVLVVDQVFGRNSYVNLTNTNVFTPSNTRMANVSSASMRLRDRDNRYGISASGAVSLLYDSLSHKPVEGHSASLGFGKYGGAFIAGYNFGMISDQFNPNDLGYLRNNNLISNSLAVSHRFLNPAGIYNNMSNTLEIDYNLIYKGARFSEFLFNYGFQILYKNYWDTRITLKYSPMDTHDWYEPRTADRYFIRPSYTLVSVIGSSDYRRKLAFDAGVQWYRNTHGNQMLLVNAGPRLRLNNKLSLFPVFRYSINKAEEGYVKRQTDDDLVFGNRDVITVTNSLTGSYVFNNRSALSLSVRHYWSQVRYNGYYLLKVDGNLASYPDYAVNQDVDFNVFNVDLEYSLNFAPGSYLTVVWKNSISSNKTIDPLVYRSYWDNLEGTITSPQTNSFSAKVIYYLDYKRVIRSRTPNP